MSHEEQIIEAIKTALPAVVSIVIGQDIEAVEKSIPKAMWQELQKEAKKHHESISKDELIAHMPTTESGKVRVGFGSGFIVSPDGHILTNKHVVVDADAEYTVVTASEDRYIAKVLARDPLNDVAILKTEADSLPIIELADSNSARLGQSVIALGNALGEFQNTASAGIVSGLSRMITAMSDEMRAEHLRGLIQTDAAINPGNSGGPLVNLEGKAIGINSAIVYGAQNIGFAIPMNRARKDLADVLKFGRIQKPFFGIRYIPVTPELAKRFHLPVSEGVWIRGEKIPGHEGVAEGSPADQAGIREKDIILSANGTHLTEVNSLEEILDTAKIGDTLELNILRDNEPMRVPVILEEKK